MYKSLLLLLAIPLFSLAQDEPTEQLYLTADNQISKQKTNLKCTLNHDLSQGYVQTYDVTDPQDKIVKQLNQTIHADDSLQPERYASYVKSIGYEQYLVGDLKNGKPYNGFFRAKKEQVNEWLVFDFYENGVLTMQWYNDLYKTITGKDSRLNFITLNSKSTFLNGKLQTGMEIIPVHIKRGAGEVVRFADNSQTTSVMLGLYAENYGEFLKVKPLPKGFLITSLQRSSAKVTFTENGRKIEFFDASQKLVKTQHKIQAELDDTKKIDPKLPYVYFQKDHQIYKEQDPNPSDGRDQRDYSRALEQVASSLFNNTPLNTAFFVRFLESNGMRSMPLGYHSIDEGKEYGYRYRKGSGKGTYSGDFYENGKITKPAQYSFKDKTPEQIVLFMETLK